MDELGGAGPGLLIAATVPDTIKAFLLPYADHFRNSGWRVDAMSSGISAREDLRSHFDAVYDVNWSRNPLSSGNFAETPERIREIIKDGGYDIIHVHTPVASFIMRYATRKIESPSRPKVVYTAHGFHFFRGGGRVRNMIFRRLEKKAGKWTDRLIVINHEDLEASARYGIVPGERLVYMPGIGLDFSKYDPSSVSHAEIRRTRDEIGLRSDDSLFTMVASFDKGKRHEDVIRAMSKIKNPDIHVAFAGNGPLREKIQLMARTSLVHHRTHFLGQVKDPRSLMLASKATIMSSEREGLSRAAMESICLGVPVIGSDARGVRDVIQPRRGLLFPTGDPLALRDAMLQIYDEPYPRVTPDPEWRIENLIDKHEALYSVLLEESRRVPEAAIPDSGYDEEIFEAEMESEE
ncbi:MAG: glycosyltransferase [Synergistaceae bacterium]|jgi:glycosyltransferase involved in cell wall biosynthesis|nr:glycosyltransferase [Synergistaceae bacterium]